MSKPIGARLSEPKQKLLAGAAKAQSPSATSLSRGLLLPVIRCGAALRLIESQ